MNEDLIKTSNRILNEAMDKRHMTEMLAEYPELKQLLALMNRFKTVFPKPKDHLTIRHLDYSDYERPWFSYNSYKTHTLSIGIYKKGSAIMCGVRNKGGHKDGDEWLLFKEYKEFGEKLLKDLEIIAKYAKKEGGMFSWDTLDKDHMIDVPGLVQR